MSSYVVHNIIVTDMQLIGISFDLFDGETTIEFPRAKNSDPVIKNLNFNIRRVGVIPMHNSIQPGIRNLEF